VLTSTGSKYRIALLLYTISTKFQRLYPCFRHRTTRLDYSEECLMCRKGRNQRWRQNEETSLIADRCLVQQEILNVAHLGLKAVSMTQYIFTNAIMFGASVIFILSILLPVFGYADFANGLPICRTVFALYVHV